MRTLPLFAAALGLLGGALSAQIQLSVQSANDAGVALTRSNGTRAVQSFAAGTVFSQPRSVTIAEGSLGGILGQLGLGASMFLNHHVFPPGAWPFGVLPDRMDVHLGNNVSAALGASFGSLHTTGDPAGNPGPQRYDVTLTHAGPTRAQLTFLVTAHLLDSNSTASIRVTGGGVQESWSWTGPIETADRAEVTVSFQDSLTLSVELSGLTSAPGGGFFGNGFHTSLRIRAAVAPPRLTPCVTGDSESAEAPADDTRASSARDRTPAPAERREPVHATASTAPAASRTGQGS